MKRIDLLFREYEGVEVRSKNCVWPTSQGTGNSGLKGGKEILIDMRRVNESWMAPREKNLRSQ